MVYNFENESFEGFYNHLPKVARVIGVELTEDAEALETFKHGMPLFVFIGSRRSWFIQEGYRKIPSSH